MRSAKAPVDSSKETVTIRAKHRDEEGRTLVDTGVHRLDRRPTDGRGGVRKPAAKKGHGGKFTWEGPDVEAENEMEAVGAIDEGDPNYVLEEEENEMGGGEESLVREEVEAVKAAEAREGVARVDVDPRLNV